MMFGPDRRIVRRTARRTSRPTMRRQGMWDEATAPEPEPAPQPPAPAPAPPLAGQETIEARLQQLADLHSSGALTDDEFARAKAKLLAG